MYGRLKVQAPKGSKSVTRAANKNHKQTFVKITKKLTRKHHSTTYFIYLLLL